MMRESARKRASHQRREAGNWLQVRSLDNPMIVNGTAYWFKQHCQQITDRATVDIIDGGESLPFDVVEVGLFRDRENLNLGTFTYEGLAWHFDVLPGSARIRTWAAVILAMLLSSHGLLSFCWCVKLSIRTTEQDGWISVSIRVVNALVTSALGASMAIVLLATFKTDPTVNGGLLYLYWLWLSLFYQGQFCLPAGNHLSIWKRGQGNHAICRIAVYLKKVGLSCLFANKTYLVTFAKLACHFFISLSCNLVSNYFKYTLDLSKNQVVSDQNSTNLRNSQKLVGVTT